jgi:putative ABC transport system permease protein
VLKLALRNIFRHKLRTALTLTAIATGVAALILSGGFVQDMFYQLAEATVHFHTGHLQIHRTNYHERGSREPEKFMIENSAEVRAAAEASPETVGVMERIYFSGLINNGQVDYPILGEGIEADKEAKLSDLLNIIAGRRLTEQDRYGIMLGEGVARAQALKAGDRATIVLNTAQGGINSLDFEVIGIFRTTKDYDDRAVRIPLATAQELLDTKGVNALVVELKETSQTDTARQKIQAHFDPKVYQVMPWHEIDDFYAKAKVLYQNQFGVLQLIILAMVVLSVANSVSMGTFERIGEFGTLMALGDRSNGIFKLIMMENILQGFLGSLTGVIVGVVLALIISAIGIPMPPPPNMNGGYTAYILLTPGVVIEAFCVGIAATVLAALIPARRVSRIPVITALRENT